MRGVSLYESLPSVQTGQGRGGKPSRVARILIEYGTEVWLDIFRRHRPSKLAQAITAPDDEHSFTNLRDAELVGRQVRERNVVTGTLELPLKIIPGFTAVVAPQVRNVLQQKEARFSRSRNSKYMTQELAPFGTL